MFKHTHHSTTYLAAAVAALVLAGLSATEARANFILWNNEQLTVNTYHSNGWLYDQSRADIVAGGTVDYLYAYDSRVARPESIVMQILYLAGPGQSFKLLLLQPSGLSLLP